LFAWDQPGLAALQPVRERVERLFVECAVRDLSGVTDLPRLRELTIASGNDPAQIDFARMSALETLWISGKGSRLEGVQHAPRLRVLRLIACALPDLRRLGAIPRLEELTVSESPLKSLAGLGGMPSLRTLVLTKVPMGDLTGLDAAPALSTLGVFFAPSLRSIKEAVGLRGLESLELMGCRGITDVSRVGEMTRLHNLWLAGVDLGDPSFLARLKGLTALKLENVGAIPSLDFLAGMTKLESVMLVENTTVVDGDLSVLLRLPALKQALYRQRRHYRPPKAEVEASITARQKGS
jgi:internalin A